MPIYGTSKGRKSQCLNMRGNFALSPHGRGVSPTRFQLIRHGYSGASIKITPVIAQSLTGYPSASLAP